MFLICSWILFALRQEEPRLQRVEAEVLILESPTRPEAAETDRGPARVVAASATVFVVDLPRGASTLEVSRDGRKRKIDVATVPAVDYDRPAKFRIDPRADSVEVDNSHGSTRLVVISIHDKGERQVAAEIVEAGAKRTLALSPGVRVSVVDPASGSGVRCVPPAASAGIRFNTGPFQFRGITPRMIGVFGFDLSMSAPDRSYTGVMGKQPEVQSVRVDLSFDGKSFEAAGFGAAADFDFLVWEAEIFFGNWRGTARVGNGETDIDGSLLGVKIDAYWPMLVYRSDSWEFGAGPEVGFLWIQEEIEAVKNAPFTIEDTLRETAFSVGPSAGADFVLGPGRLSVRASALFLWGDLQGFGGELSLGYTIRF